MSWKLEKEKVELDNSVLSSAAESDEKTRKIVHLFDDRDRHAINAALAAGRPLLVRGEPGVGKSQLARAAAEGLGRRFVSKVIDARTEAQDLLWTFDAVRRLADAQVLAAEKLRDGETVALRLSEDRYVDPGPLWWGFDWRSAGQQAAWFRGVETEVEVDEVPGGVVVLLDEIDKADSSVPNGLLEALGNQQFQSMTGATVRCSGRPPLIVVTTNEERSLPDAFLRRCLVLHMKVPEREKDLIAWLTRRGRAHFDEEQADDDLLAAAARMLADDRVEIRRQGLSPPGGAEYLDLLRAVVHLGTSLDERRKLLDQVAQFTLKKHPELDGESLQS